MSDRTNRALLTFLGAALSVLLGSWPIVANAVEVAGDIELGTAPNAAELVLDEQEAQDEPLEASTQPVYRTEDQIRSFFESHSFGIRFDAEYAVEPSTTVPYDPGVLSQDTLQQALNATNFVRYVAGVNSIVTLSDDFVQAAQAGALVNAANGTLSHFPAQPAGMSDALYSLGYRGTSSSNIIVGSYNPAWSVLSFMLDYGANNYNDVGHRRWILSPGLAHVGFGQVGYWGTMYVVDGSGGSGASDVPWPARNMPIELFGASAQWSYSTDSPVTDQNFTVRVIRRGDGKTWNLSEAAETVAVDESYPAYDRSAIIWSLEDVREYRNGDTFDVTISGSSWSSSYTVTFFDLYHVNYFETEMDGVGTIADGQTVTLNQADGYVELRAWYGDTVASWLDHGRDCTFAASSINKHEVEFTSSNPSVVSVGYASGTYDLRDDVPGYVPGYYYTNLRLLKPGVSTITATLSDGKTISFDLRVEKPPTPQITLIPIYRMYNTKTSEHLWTKSKAEYNACGSGNYRDWRRENVAWYSPDLKAPASYDASTQGDFVYVWRLYDKGRTGDHIYLTYGAEMRQYLSNGWVVDKGAGFWTLKQGATISGKKTIPIYRAYNPKLKRGKHHYTPSKVEYDKICKNNGWKPEGTKFYVIKK